MAKKKTHERKPVPPCKRCGKGFARTLPREEKCSCIMWLINIPLKEGEQL